MKADSSKRYFAFDVVLYTTELILRCLTTHFISVTLTMSPVAA
jgi:hypothetical protein